MIEAPDLDAPSRASRDRAHESWSITQADQAPAASLYDVRGLLMRRSSDETMLLTSAYGGQQGGSLVHCAQPSTEPPIIVVVLPPRPLVASVLIESRMFAICRMAVGDRLLERRFDEDRDPDEDPFLGLDADSAPAGSPVPRRVISWVECELAFYLDLEADNRLCVGRIIAAGRR